MSEYPLASLAPRPLPQQRAFQLQRPGWPLPLHTQAPKPDFAATGERFEAMILAQLLAAARSHGPNPLTGDTDLSAGQSLVHEQIDRTRAALIARAAPLGMARLVEGAR